MPPAVFVGVGFPASGVYHVGRLASGVQLGQSGQVVNIVELNISETAHEKHHSGCQKNVP